MIALGLSTIRKADKIRMLEQGRLVEVGDNDTFMNREGAFYQLAKRQLQ